VCGRLLRWLPSSIYEKLILDDPAATMFAKLLARVVVASNHGRDVEIISSKAGLNPGVVYTTTTTSFPRLKVR
jgi:hypothetical protein